MWMSGWTEGMWPSPSSIIIWRPHKILPCCGMWSVCLFLLDNSCLVYHPGVDYWGLILASSFPQEDNVMKASLAVVVPTPNNGSAEVVRIHRSLHKVQSSPSRFWWNFRELGSWSRKSCFAGGAGHSFGYYNSWRGHETDESLAENERHYGTNQYVSSNPLQSIWSFELRKTAIGQNLINFHVKFCGCFRNWILIQTGKNLVLQYCDENYHY